MNVGQVRQLARQLTGAAEQLRSLVSSIDGRVHASTWVGRDADTFKHQWWPHHRQAVLTAAEAIEGLGRSASNNADDQERTSSASGSGAGASSAVGSPAWLGVAGGALATGGVLAGQLASELNDEFDPFAKAKSLAELTQNPFFDDANAPVKGFIGDIVEDGRIKTIGKGLDVISYGAQGYELYTDYHNGDYLELGLDGADDVGNQLKGHFGLPGYLGGVAINEWTDVVRDAEKVDWNMNDASYSQYMNPFVAKNWTQTILPGAWDGVKQGFGQTLENLLP